MALKRIVPEKYPRRHWALIGAALGGKSTFAAQMRGPNLVIDADHRFAEMVRAHGCDALAISEDPSDNVDVARIVACLEDGVPGAGVKTITVDSLTAIISPVVQRALLANMHEENKNKAAAWAEKATTMKILMDGVTRWGTDTLFIWHEEKGRGAKGEEEVKETLSDTERDRLTRCLDVELRIVGDNGKRGIEVAWSRYGKSGVTLWDDTKTWQGMPEKVEAAIYGPEGAAFLTFKSGEEAQAWAVSKGYFASLEKAKDAYTELRGAIKPKAAADMFAAWVKHCEARDNAGT